MAGAYVFGTFNAKTVISVPPAKWTEGNEAAESWREFVASLESAGARVFAASKTDQDRREGLAYLSQLTAAALEMKAAKGSSAQPQLTDWMVDYRKFLGDSPDAIYHTAQLSADFEYEISGNRGDAEYLGFMLYGRGLNGWNRAAANISDEAIKFDSDGNFRLILGKNKPAENTAANGEANWLALEDDIHMLMVRQYYHGREGKKKAELKVRNLAPPEFTPQNDQDVSRALARATTFFNETVDGAIALSEMLSTGANNIDPPKGYNADFGGIFYPTDDNDYYGSWFHLKEDEALVIEGAAPEALYWAVSLQNRWMQSLDYVNYPVALNDEQITVENGRYRVVVAHKKPPSGDWLSTAGRQEGLLSIRYQRASRSEEPTLTLVKFSEL